MEWRFKLGDVYYAAPAMPDARRRIAVLVGRDGRAAQFAFVNELAIGEVGVVDGREIAFVDTDVGRYNVSAAVRASADEAAVIRDILRGESARGGRHGAN